MGPKDPTGCYYEGEFHKSDSNWKSNDCMECSCIKDGSVKCCAIVLKPVKYNKKKCTAIYDQDNCVYHVVRNDNPCKTCPSHLTG
ncbi:beta-microseminoprotein-like [Engystomops pustulosus]|uniref:beta-microseminoprotein-like n=1 Tax=Engystomops pustulosus TaxID=76066 RepID=UPI003AFB1025